MKILLMIILLFSNCIFIDNIVDKQRIRQLFQLMVEEVRDNKTGDFYRDFDRIFKSYKENYKELENIDCFHGGVLINSTKLKSYKVYSTLIRFRVYSDYRKLCGKVFYKYFEIYH